MIFYEEDKNNYQIVPGITLKEEQLDAIDFSLHKFNCIFNLSTGLGKCKKAGSRVLTRFGYKKIESLVPGANVGFTPLKVELWTGKEWAHTKNFYKEEGALVRNLICKDGQTVNGTLAHPISVFSDTIELRKIEDISVGDYIAFKREIPSFGYTEINSFESYVLGLWIGDGSHGTYKRGYSRKIIYSVEGESEIISRVSEYFNLKMYDTKNNTVKVTFPVKSSFSRRLRKLEGDRKSNSKIIPEIIFRSKDIEREALLWGLIDSDGHVSDDGLEYVTKSKELAGNIIHLNQTLGIRASIKLKVLTTGKYKGNRYYRFQYRKEDLCRKKWEFKPEWSRKWRKMNELGISTINSTDSILLSKKRAKEILDSLTEDREELKLKRRELERDKYREEKRSVDNSISYLREIISGKKSGISSIHSNVFKNIRPYVEDLLSYYPVKVVGYSDEVCDVYDVEMDTEEHVFYCDGLINHNTCCALVASYQIMRKANDAVTFIVCPKQANTAFKKELTRLGFKYSISVTGEKHYTNGSRFFIFNYSNPDEMISLLVKLKSGERRYRVIGIFDEVHTLGNPKSGITQKMMSVRKYFSACLSLSATPLLNDFEGLWSVCNFVKPGEMGSWWDFKSRWLITRKRTIRVKGGRSRQVEEIIGYRNLDLLRQTLSNFIITRSYEYPLRYYYRECTLTQKEMEIYQLAAEGILDEEKQEDYAPRLWNLQRVADGCDEKSQELGVLTKQKLLITVLKEILDRGEGSLIYTELEDTYSVLGDLIEKYKGYLGYHKLWYITGKIEYSKRVKCEKTLQAKDLVIITKAGSASINLQAVNNVVFYDLSFAVGSILQAIGRVARVDSKYENQNITFLEAKDTIDSYKRLLMQSNMTVVQEVFGKSSIMPYYGDIDNDVAKKYRQYLKNTMLWKR